ncbi:MAG: hypothetical protein H7296_05860 [Bacteroidia bacterium]|nr:hypothetical protein [Bacteroidia bacterium]
MMNKFLGLIVLSITLSSCYNDKEEQLYINEFAKNTDTTHTDTVTYSKDIHPLMTGSCAISGCHVSGASFPDLSAYTGLKANINRVKVRAVIDKTMPASGPLSLDKVAKLQSWINSGALNN